ncbi:CD3324 family protein [Pseudalkalibacillus caeni]|uniref:Mor transcription activator domain-containing protein n=1 Tax=Exobacillus caeni TaxID=2574798 RepID=A0A5R9F8M5_9BACL|nr:CD3324 family protein [Pseudalkalibacillus caeni]TLS36874.1 hypothetical protein FCL54_13030 [Pseudalkalibacillus caeni]
MQYKNGKEVFPPNLLKELQNYIEGELIYIPKKSDQRARWGELSGSRKLITKRNEEIFQNYKEGYTFKELEKKYHLSIESIRKIIYKTREKDEQKK